MIPSAAFIATPRRFLEPVDYLDMDRFADRWEYAQDPLWGLYDIARSPFEVLDQAEGDCVDFARLAASHLFYNTAHDIALYVAAQRRMPPGHVIVYDGVRCWSTGEVYEESPVEYGIRTDRDLMVRRRVRGSVGSPVIVV